MCNPNGFGTQCRGDATAICAERPERNGGGNVVQTTSCESLSCSEQYGRSSAVCLPRQGLTFCAPSRVIPVGKGPVATYPTGGTLQLATSEGNDVRVQAVDPPGAAARSATFDAPAFDLALADFNGDGEVDVLARTGSAAAGVTHSWIALGSGDAFLPPAPVIDGFGLIDWIADIDGDGRDDVVAYRNGQLMVSWSGENGLPSGETVLYADSLSSSGTLHDFDDDGKREVVIVDTRPWNVTTLKVMDVVDRSLVPRMEREFDWGTPTAVQMFDLDGDGKLEIVVSALTGRPLASLAVLSPTELGAPTFPKGLPQSAAVFTLARAGAAPELVLPAGYSPTAARLRPGQAPQFFADPADPRPLATVSRRSTEPTPSLVLRRGAEVVVFDASSCTSDK